MNEYAYAIAFACTLAVLFIVGLVFAKAERQERLARERAEREETFQATKVRAQPIEMGGVTAGTGASPVVSFNGSGSRVPS
jgi:hypothetical protein